MDHVSLDTVIVWTSKMEKAGEYDSSLASRMRVSLQRAESVLDPTRRFLGSLRRPYLDCVAKALSRHYADATVKGYVRLLERARDEYKDM